MTSQNNEKLEQWKPLSQVGKHDFEGKYEVSDLGRIRSLRDRKVFANGGKTRIKSGLMQQQKKSGSNYRFVHLPSSSGKIVSEYIHTLVLTAFVGPRPDGKEACHWNDKSYDNRLSNLRWDTRSHNMNDGRFNRNSATVRLPVNQAEWEFLEWIEAKEFENQFVEKWIEFKRGEAA
jgi:hypothetical protein